MRNQTAFFILCGVCLCSMTYAGRAFQNYKMAFFKKPIATVYDFAKSKTSSLSLKTHIPDLLFRLIANNDVQKKKSVSSRYSIDEHGSELDELYKAAGQLETSAGYHVIWASVFTKNARFLEELAKKAKASKGKIYGIKDSFGNNLLHICCFLRWSEGIKILFENGSDISSWNKKNSLGKTPIDICEEFGDEQTKNIILKHAKNNQSILGKLGRKGKDRYSRKQKDDDDYYYDNDDRSSREKNSGNTDESVRKLLGYSLIFFDIFDSKHIKDFHKGVRSTKGKLLSQTIDKYKNNILHILALFGKDDSISTIMSDRKSAEIEKALNSQNTLGNTPLHIAVSMNNLPTVSGLLKCDKANLCLKNASNTIPLTLAIRNYKEIKTEKQDAYNIICELLNYGDEHGNNQLNIKDSHGNTAYHFSCMQLIMKVIAELIRHGMNVNKTNKLGLTGGDILANKLGRQKKRESGKEIGEEKLESIFSAIELMSQSQGKGRDAAVELLSKSFDITH